MLQWSALGAAFAAISLAGEHPTATTAAVASGSPTAREITPDEAGAWKPRVDIARQYANSRAGRVTFAAFDMKGRFHRFDGNHSVPMASTFKVMLMVAYLRQRSVADRELTSSEHALIKPMIRWSDNEAATRIRDMLGRGPIERLADRARMQSFQWHAIWGYCRTTARDQALFMRNLGNFVPRRHRQYALHQLAQIVPSQRWGIGKVDLPRTWRLHFKGGWGSGSGAVDHQVALLRNGPRRIGLAVTTEGNVNHDYGKQTLKGVFRRLLRGLPG